VAVVAARGGGLRGIGAFAVLTAGALRFEALAGGRSALLVGGAGLTPAVRRACSALTAIARGAGPIRATAAGAIHALIGRKRVAGVAGAASSTARADLSPDADVAFTAAGGTGGGIAGRRLRCDQGHRDRGVLRVVEQGRALRATDDPRITQGLHRDVHPLADGLVRHEQP